MMEKLSGIYGHSNVSERLAQAAKSGKLFNSYVFEGAKGCGKKTTADLFCAAVMCKNKEKNLPCGECDACRKVFSHNHPDVIYVKRDDGKKTIGVDNIRENVVNNVYIKPMLADKKIFVITDGSDLTEQSQNALLKILEEPPEYASFIIITENAGFLLQTVRSRSVVLSFLPVADSVTQKVLFEKTNGKYSENEIRFASRFARGVPGKGLEILENEDFTRLYNETVKKMIALFDKKNTVSDFEKFLNDEKEKVDLVIDFMITFVRDCILAKKGCENLVVCENYLVDIKKVCESVSTKTLARLSELILEYNERLKYNAAFVSATMDMLLNMREQIKA